MQEVTSWPTRSPLGLEERIHGRNRWWESEADRWCGRACMWPPAFARTSSQVHMQVQGSCRDSPEPGPVSDDATTPHELLGTSVGRGNEGIHLLVLFGLLGMSHFSLRARCEAGRALGTV